MQEIKCPSCGKEFTLDEAGYADILAQVRNYEFEDALAERLALAESSKQTEIELAKVQAAQKLEAELAEKQTEIERLKAEAKAEKTERELAVTKAVAKVEKERDEAKGEAEKLAYEMQLGERTLKEKYESEIQVHKDAIEKLKDFKAQLSTKMLGETLELHCENSFNSVRAGTFPNAEFHKDNEVVDGTKGDYVFREKVPGTDSDAISIMFEMKNEADATEKKQKNEQFLEKLDKDRKKKRLEYAILVTTLEPDNPLYNDGILDVSYKYEKMYVIRPQFFIPLITLLRNAALKANDDRKELARIQSENLDVTMFKDEIQKVKDYLSKNYKFAKTHFEEAISQIDKSIAAMQKVKKELELSERNLRLMDQEAQDHLTVKHLTAGNETMAAKFAELEPDA